MGRKIFAFFLFLILCGLGGSLYLEGRWQRYRMLDHEKLIEIPNGFSANQTAQLLVDQEIVESLRDFKLYLRFKDMGAKLKSGVYVFRDSASVASVAQTLVKGETASLKVTIPEGRTSWEIYGILKNSFPELDSTQWSALIYDSRWAKSLGVKADNLEGYLFPNTYNFPLRASAGLLQETMVHQFHKVFAELNFENSEVFLKYGELGTVTLASVVEEESAVPQERGKIAGVFYNRLQLGMPLGADPTVRFIFRNLTGPIYRSQLNSDSPYNTRKFAGLPPGPISNPGREALKAALFPEKHKELYFVAKDDGSREHFFTSKLSDHNKYKDIAARNRGE